MAETLKIPTYTVYIISGNTKYNVTPAVVSMNRSEAVGQIAQRVNLQLTDAQVDNGSWLSVLIKPRDRVSIYANDGSKNEEIFRGFVWSRNTISSTSDRKLNYTCYDNLIYFQESEESLYFSSGKKTKDVVSSICSTWGVKLNYSYSSITHTKLPLRGKLYDILTCDILDLVKKQTGKKYVILSDKDTVYIKPVGSNATIYHFLSKQNISSTTVRWSMDGFTTKIVIVGKADKNDKEPIEAVVTGNTSKYGTLQKIHSLKENTSIEDAKKEAQNTIKENESPKLEFDITAPDIPWIRKGDKIFVNAGNIKDCYLIVTAIERTISPKNNTMTLTLEYA